MERIEDMYFYLPQYLHVAWLDSHFDRLFSHFDRLDSHSDILSSRIAANSLVDVVPGTVSFAHAPKKGDTWPECRDISFGLVFNFPVAILLVWPPIPITLKPRKHLKTFFLASIGHSARFLPVSYGVSKKILLCIINLPLELLTQSYPLLTVIHHF